MLENTRIDAWWRTIKTAYLARDIGSIYQLMPEDRTVDNHELAQLFKERMIDRRNQRMVERMAHRLAEGKTFIAVGALHLPGERGLLNLLAERATRSRASTEPGAWPGQLPNLKRPGAAATARDRLRTHPVRPAEAMLSESLWRREHRARRRPCAHTAELDASAHDGKAGRPFGGQHRRNEVARRLARGSLPRPGPP